MDTAKEFEGKTLDEAIREACAYFDLPREKLEIDIVRDAKSGIFGLVGTRKAAIRAKRAEVSTAVGTILGSPLRENRQTEKSSPPRTHIVDEDVESIEDSPPPRDDKSDVPPARDRRKAKPKTIREQMPPKQPNGQPGRRSRRDAADTAGSNASGQVQLQPKAQSRAPVQAQPPAFDAEYDFNDDHDAGRSAIPLASLDQDLLHSAVYDTACRLIRPIVPDANLIVEIGGSRVAVHIASEEDLGLLIGREGQTLASIQYLAARIVARKVGAPVRIQLDAGDYRERQDEKLRSLALALADRVRLTGRSCTTRPLSSYQRRIVHMALQDDPSIQTRSAGDGPLKRVVIQRSRAD